VNGRIAVNPMATFDLALEAEVELLASLGTRVGLSAQKLADRGWDDGLGVVAAAGLQVDYLVDGIFSPVDDTAGWAHEARMMGRAIDGAAELGAGFVYFCTGPPGQLRWEAAAARLAERLAPAVEQAKGRGVALAVENGMSIWSQCSFVFTLRDALDLARRLDIGVCADLYGCWIEPGLERTLREAGERLLLVQVSDRELASLSEPDRRVLGDADLPLDRLLGDVLDAGYPGVFDIELFGPRIEAEGAASALRRSIAWLESALDRAAATRAAPVAHRAPEGAD